MHAILIFSDKPKMYNCAAAQFLKTEPNSEIHAA